MNDQLTPKEARILYMILEEKSIYEAMRKAVMSLYGRDNDKKFSWPRTIKRKVKKLYESQFKPKETEYEEEDNGLKPTRIALAYCSNSAYATLYKPGSGQLQTFERKYGFAMTIGCVHFNYPKTKKEIGIYWIIHFHHAVIRDKVDPMALHKVLLQIPEYRNLCAGDIPFLGQYSDEDNREYGLLCVD